MPILRPEQAYAQSYFQYEEPLSEAELAVETKLVRKIDEYRPKLDDFVDIYSQTEINKDKNKLTKQKEKEIKETHQRALILEAILADQIEKANWFGENCSVAFASEYDNCFQHADLILEFDQGDKIVRLAVDATMAQNLETLEKKRNYIKKDIEKTRLTNLKYFRSESEIDGTEGSLSAIPRVIINISKENIKELSELIVNKENKKLANFHGQLGLLQAIKNQLEDEIAYALLYFRKFPKKADYIVKKHEQVLDIINEVLRDKKRILGVEPRISSSLWTNDIKALAYLDQKGY